MVVFCIQEGDCEVLYGVSFDIFFGEIVVIVGEFGLGKFMMVSVIVNLLFGMGVVIGGLIIFDGWEFIKLNCCEMEVVCGCEIGFVLQDFMLNLNLVWSIGFQVKEVICVNGIVCGKENVKV